MKKKPFPASTGLLISLFLPLAALSQEPEPDSVVTIEPINVEIGRIRAGAVPISQTPFSSQVLTSNQLRPVAGSRIAGALTRLPGVSLTNQTGSPSQFDIRVRGSAISPIVGVPQSVSVFVDGVRVNEADASQVHLSLIPETAIERIEFLRGPVGVFGKNSIAGALNFVTRRAGDAATIEAEMQGGSFGSGAGSVTASSRLGSFDGLFSGSYRKSEGWRPLEYAQEVSLFGKLGWSNERTDAWLSYTFEADSLEGPGPLPESWIKGGPLPPEIISYPSDRRRLQYTGGVGDAFRPRLHFINGKAERELADSWKIQASGFGRFADFRQSNDNISEPDALGLTNIASYGSTIQLLHERRDALLFSAGAEWSRNDVDIEIRKRPNRNFPSILETTTERLKTDEDNYGTFGEVWWGLSPRLSLYSSVRFDYVKLPVEDLMDPSDSGENTFSEVSGGLGLTIDFGAGLGGFLSYGRGFRAPVIIEVTCSDPTDPCQLPFELGPDPELKPVKSDSWEAGIRVTKERLQGSIITYWSEVRDDIFNVIDEATPTLGYFTNLDRTRRVGVEASAAALLFSEVPGLSVTGSLGVTRATFQTHAELASPLVEDEEEDEEAGTTLPGLSEDDEGGAVKVEPGDIFPMIPFFTGTVGLRYETGPTLFEIETDWTSKQFLVGNESNEEPFQMLPARLVLDVRAEHTIGQATLFAEISNFLDSDYSAFGIISENRRGATEQVERFLTPGLPRRITAGIRVRFGGE